MDLTSPFYNDVPQKSTKDAKGRVRASCTAFIRNIVIPAVQELPANLATAKTGLRYLSHDVRSSYHVISRDYRVFARLITGQLIVTDTRVTCGMSNVRFYMAEHGLKLGRDAAESFLREIVNVDHEHVDVVQIHRDFYTKSIYTKKIKILQQKIRRMESRIISLKGILESLRENDLLQIEELQILRDVGGANSKNCKYVVKYAACI